MAANLHSVNGNGGPLRTPNIKRLANRGTWFTRAYADAPACCPSHTALVIGVHAARSGVYCAGFFPTEDAADVPDVNPEKDGSRWQDETFTAAK